jgi:hypothetical protein
MEALLLQLLQDLELVSEDHGEVYDSDVREQMRAVITNGLVRQVSGYAIPESFGMFSDEGDRLVKQALERYLAAAKQQVAERGLTNLCDRLAAFQNEDVVTPSGLYYDDFFGWSPPEQFDDVGPPGGQPADDSGGQEYEQ